jgi:hypothetical protein
LNPQFQEWLMGWPFNWTELQPLEMDRFRSWLRLHSVRFTNASPIAEAA